MGSHASTTADIPARFCPSLSLSPDFERTLLQPGDPGYVYDKQVEFGEPTEESEWD
jgi:hypothetical protein